jgi:hypothetical protein
MASRAVVALVLAPACVLGGCSLLVDLGSLQGASSTDAGGDAGGDAGLDGQGDAVSGPCAFTSVQATPGTTQNQVIHQSASAQQSIFVTAGDLLVAVAYGGQNPGQTTPPTTAPNMTFAVSDTLGNTFYAAPMVENSSSHQAAIQIFYAPNIKGGSDIVTATSATSSGITLWTGLFLQEYSGAATTDVVDVSSGQMAPLATATASPPNLVTGTSCDLVVGGFADGHVLGQSLSPVAGWVMRSSDDWDPAAAFDNAPTPTLQSISVAGGINLSSGADDGWVAEQVAFRGAYTTALPQPDTLAFTSPSYTVAANGCSGKVVVEARKGATAAATATGITMTVSAPTLTFFADSACAAPITSLFIGAGATSQYFYFKGASAGSPSITVSATGFTPVVQGETIN